jgi:hypothetical protein
MATPLQIQNELDFPTVAAVSAPATAFPVSYTGESRKTHDIGALFCPSVAPVYQ